MQRFFFDVDDGERQVHDAIGKSLVNVEMAALEADVLLRSLAALKLMQSRPGRTFVRVRDAEGKRVHEGSTYLEG
ncbi:MAG: DUF6894 family protein [Janthinobacterium lividum]